MGAKPARVHALPASQIRKRKLTSRSTDHASDTVLESLPASLEPMWPATSIMGASLQATSTGLLRC